MQSLWNREEATEIKKWVQGYFIKIMFYHLLRVLRAFIQLGWNWNFICHPIAYDKTHHMNFHMTIRHLFTSNHMLDLFDYISQIIWLTSDISTMAPPVPLETSALKYFLERRFFSNIKSFQGLKSKWHSPGSNSLLLIYLIDSEYLSQSSKWRLADDMVDMIWHPAPFKLI